MTDVLRGFCRGHRLTRSLANFAKLVELFDRHDVSFVCVTQQFNITTSMRRLTLTVLLSFARFELELTSQAALTRRNGAARLRDRRPQNRLC